MWAPRPLIATIPASRVQRESCSAASPCTVLQDNIMLATAGETMRAKRESAPRKGRAEVPYMARVLFAAPAARRDRRPFPPRGFHLHRRRQGSPAGERRAGHADAAGRALDAAGAGGPGGARRARDGAAIICDRAAADRRGASSLPDPRASHRLTATA